MYPYCYVPLIRKNTPIPVSKSEGFCTVFDGQSKVDINVYQGEDPDALNNIEIGRFTIEGLRDAPAGNPLITTFSLDVNGILQVTSREKNTGLVHSITIDNAISRFTGDKLAEARQRIDGCLVTRRRRRGAARRKRRGFTCRRQQTPARRSRRPDREGRASAGQRGH
jgi:molecular chaperone DnaK